MTGKININVNGGMVSLGAVSQGDGASVEGTVSVAHASVQAASDLASSTLHTLAAQHAYGRHLPADRHILQKRRYFYSCC